MARKISKPVDMKEALQSTLRKLHLDRQILASNIWSVWEEVVGEAVAQRTQPEKIRHGTLFVTVTNSSWMQQLQFIKEDLRQKLNTALQSDEIGEIRFRVGTIESQRDTKAGNKSKGRASRKDSPLSEETRVQLASGLELIKDEGIREAIQSLLNKKKQKK